MMSSYICRQCRKNIFQRAVSLRSPQWQPNATFISLRNPQPTPGPQQEVSEHTTSTQANDGNSTQAEAVKDARIRRATTTKTFQFARPERSQGGRYSRYKPPNKEAEPEKLGQDSKEGQDGLEVTQLEGPPIRKLHQGVSGAFYIDDRMEAGNLQAAWRIILNTYTSKDCPALLDPSDRLLKGGMFRKFLEVVVRKVCEGAEVPVTPTNLMRKYEEIGVMRPDFWKSTILTLTDQVLRQSPMAASDARELNKVLPELMSVWQLFFQCKGTLDVPLQSEGHVWQSIPDAQTLRATIAGSSERDFRARLQQYIPKFVANNWLSFSAVAVFNIFNERNELSAKLDETLRAQNEPFLRLLVHVLAGASMRSAFWHIETSHEFKALPEQIQKDVIKQISSAPSEAKIVLGVKDFEVSQPSNFSNASSREAKFLKRISRAILEKSHKGVLGNLWEEVIRAYTPKGNKTIIPPEIYNSFLTGFMALFEPDRTIEVWNHMIAHGLRPDVKSWTAMIVGCEKARDLEGMKQMWTRMLRSGVQPDIYAWTARIHGFMYLRNTNAAFAALDEMGQSWLAGEQAMKGSAKKSSPTPKANPFVKPTIEVVNAALSGLANIPRPNLPFNRKSEMMQNILLWGRTFALRPDAHTYNTLIQFYLTSEDYHTASKLLQKMEVDGIEPDIVTYTMLLRSAFDDRQFSGLSEEQQTSKVISILTELEKSGIKLNAYIYSSIVDRLLKLHSNFSAVRAVIDHMMSRNLIASAQIYTSLITHYFQESPPNIPAVDSLWLQITQTPGTPIDKILFDRVIEGYASVGEVGKMMAALVRMSAHGKLPGWTALTAVVRALTEAGDFQRARDVVRDVSNGEGVAQGGIKGDMWRRQEFWEEARRCRILDEGMEDGAMPEEEFVKPIEVEEVVSSLKQADQEVMKPIESAAEVRHSPHVKESGDGERFGGVPM
ncbi:uncharacterized protein BDR25DRAFT_78379 [Lindgomyces ingoldianus]|uniref:Uncharacterized protein n=1 Tax=Lindgomyces ingoldianus TaxID=673940 RepID=A0ACB6QHI6_9PLEO|nr:uncharacterized protein BDR25DRAFT_78379 [Lindgomyces ingoldianus]KAF2466443.1 hypothetical protein BDR25DRAFT_78379 [Lindgomyces ingoldianus]